jgi:DNA invertase Pin-like site-specific DNA recombinase
MVKKPIRAAIYLRVSTTGQTVENQRRELEEVASHEGWQIVKTFEDAGISGAKSREKRPGLDAMLKGVSRREFDLVAAWSVDRLGRSLLDLVSTLGEIHTKGLNLYLHKQGIDTRTPAGKAMFQMLGVFAEFERAMIVDRVNAGLARARAKALEAGRTLKLGRPMVGAKVEDAIRRERATGLGIRKIAAKVGCGVGTVQRVIAA